MSDRRLFIVLLRCRRRTGIERYALNVAEELDKKGDCIVITDSSSIIDASQFSKIIYFPNCRILSEFILLPIFMMLNFRGNFFFPLFPPMPPVWLIPNLRIFRTIFDTVPWDMPETTTFLSKLLYRFPEKCSLLFAVRVFTISEFSANRLFSMVNGRRNRCEIVNCSIGPGIEARGLSVSSKEKFFLVVGTLEPRKNYLFLLKCYMAYLDLGGDLRLIVIGRKGWKVDPDVEYLIGKLCLLGKVSFLEKANDDDLASHYSRCSAVLVPSLFEGFGLPVLEGLRFNKPVIASDLEVFKEISDDVIFLPVNDLDAWVDAMVNIDSYIFDHITFKDTFVWRDTADRIFSEIADV